MIYLARHHSKGTTCPTCTLIVTSELWTVTIWLLVSVSHPPCFPRPAPATSALSLSTFFSFIVLVFGSSWHFQVKTTSSASAITLVQGLDVHISARHNIYIPWLPIEVLILPAAPTTNPSQPHPRILAMKIRPTPCTKLNGDVAMHEDSLPAMPAKGRTSLSAEFWSALQWAWSSASPTCTLACRQAGYRV